MEDYISVKQAQEMLECCTATIYKIVHSDGFPTLRKQGLKKYIISKRDFLMWCKKNNYTVKERFNESN